MPSISRRRFILDGSLALGAVGFWPPWSRLTGDGRLSARPVSHPADPLPAGDHVLDTFNGRDTVLVVPPTLALDKPVPLMLALHGATQSSEFTLRKMRDSAAAAGVLMLAPSSIDRTWDAMLGLSFTIDFERIDAALKQVFGHFAVDPHRLAIAGFSDGASYSLSVGVMNGDLFSHVIAYSPGFMIPGRRHGQPPIFISHGRNDPILPFDRCGQRLANELAHDGYKVEFVPFDDGHAVPPEIAERATHWFADVIP
jgi:phospholipase/carboxylesterase